MLTTAVNFPTRRAPSPQIRARDTSLDGTTNGSAGVDVDAGVNSAAPELGGQRRGDHEDRADGTDYRKLAEHNLRLPWTVGRSPPSTTPTSGFVLLSKTLWMTPAMAAGVWEIRDIVDVLKAWRTEWRSS